MPYRKLGRPSGARKALFRSLVTDLFLYERIQTTEAKAKELRSIADKMITLAKRGDLHARRQVARMSVRRRLEDGAGQGCGAEAVRGHRAAFQDRNWRLYPHYEDRSSSRRRRTDGLIELVQ